jgi:hypothetical protein
MIASAEQLDQTFGQLQRMYRALVALRAEVLPVNPKLFALMAEGPMEDIRRLQADIDDYTGFAQARELVGKAMADSPAHSGSGDGLHGG